MLCSSLPDSGIICKQTCYHVQHISKIQRQPWPGACPGAKLTHSCNSANLNNHHCHFSLVQLFYLKAVERKWDALFTSNITFSVTQATLPFDKDTGQRWIIRCLHAINWQITKVNADLKWTLTFIYCFFIAFCIARCQYCCSQVGSCRNMKHRAMDWRRCEHLQKVFGNCWNFEDCNTPSWSISIVTCFLLFCRSDFLHSNDWFEWLWLVLNYDALFNAKNILLFK